ncbi:unnamed protein product [Bubo scandiacus]
MAPLSLSQLLDVAIGTPQAGAVNFTALYSLLQAMLGHLGLQDLPAPGRGHSPTPLLGRDQPPEAPPREEGGQGGGPGTESLTPAKDPLQGAAVALSQDLLEEIGGMKAAQYRMEEDIRMIQETLGMGNLQDAAGQLPALRDQTALDKPGLKGESPSLTACPLGPHLDKESISSVLADLQGRVSSLQGLTSDLQGKNGKIRQLEDALGKLEVAGANWKGDVSDQITLQLGSTLQEVKCKLKELEEQQEMTKATLERLVAKTADELQEQLGEPRAMVASTGQEQAEVQAACPVCSTDISKQVGQLLQRYEKLQELVDDCVSWQAAGKVVRQLPGRSQDEELLKRIQAAVTQVQGDYEKLNSVTGNLLHDRHQKEKDIEALFRSLERLEKEKANKEDLVLGIDVKADKTALAGKVSRTQFDASMERLNEMIQETLSRVTGQEQGWHQVQRQLSEEMDSKLDRLELGPFRQQLEEHWRSTLEQLKEKEPLTEADDAAGTKKQLLAHFHCMSCDRPLSVLVPGPHIVAIPYMPPLPPHLAGRSHTVREMEQTPQHSHR